MLWSQVATKEILVGEKLKILPLRVIKQMPREAVAHSLGDIKNLSGPGAE